MIDISKEFKKEISEMDLKYRRTYNKLISLNKYVGSDKDLYFVLKRYYRNKDKTSYKPTFDI